MPDDLPRRVQDAHFDQGCIGSAAPLGPTPPGAPSAPLASLSIGILTHLKHPVRQPFAGGLEAFTYDVTQGLRQRGHAVTLFASSHSAPELKSVSILDDADYTDAGIRGVKEAFFTEYVQEHIAYLDCLQKIDRYGFDVIFNNSLHYVPIMMAPLIATPMLTVLHTPPFFEMTNAIGSTRGAASIDFCTVSQANAVNWQPWVPTCEVIPNGIDLDVWSPPSHSESGLVSNDKRAIWFGRLVRDKGVHLAMDAARLAGMALDIAGQASDPAYFECEIAPRLGPHAVYLGHLDRAAIVERVRRASVSLVTPCWDEPFGLVVAESLACGTPVAAFARGAIPHLLTSATGIAVAPDDVAALAVAARAASTLDRKACRRASERLWNRDIMLTAYEAALRRTALSRTGANA